MWLNFLIQDTPWRKEDITDFEKGYAQKYHHYITIGYITKCPEIETVPEPGHYYLSEVPSYENLDEPLPITKVDDGKQGDLWRNMAKPVIQEDALSIKNPVLSGQSLHQDDKV